jgi:hypothetical protein
MKTAHATRGRRSIRPRSKLNGRTGATMTEVLVSILIMAIGVFSVIGLFPMATLRSIRATQLTQAAILKKNAETVLGYSREVGQGGIGVGALAYLSHNPMYDPRLNGLGNSPRMVFDPVGWHLVGQQNFADRFQAANDADLTLGPILRLNGGTEVSGGISTADATEISLAYRLSSGDTWINVAESNQVTYTGPAWSATVSGASAAGLTTGGFIPQNRILFFDVTGRQCQTRPIVSVAGDVVNWDEATAAIDINGDRVFSGPLPAGFTPVSARIQSQDRRYTWIMTLPVPGRYVHVAVFFNRAYDPADELVYDCVPVGGEDDNGNGVLDPGEDDNGNGILDPVQLDFSVDNFDAAAVAAGLPQFVRRNSFALDAVNLEWYRVETINGTKVTVTTLDGRRTDELRFAIFMRGLVDVYPMQASN